jgi:hypothetical protein
VINEAAPEFSSTGFGQLVGQGDGGRVHRAPAGSGSAVATWTLNLAPGTYRVSVAWPPGPDRATNAPYTVLNGSTQTTVSVDQRLAPKSFSIYGVMWEDLGTFTVTSGTLVVRLTNLADGRVFADSLRAERLA